MRDRSGRPASGTCALWRTGFHTLRWHRSGPRTRCSSPNRTTYSTASKTFSHEVRKASAVSFQESLRAQRDRNSIQAQVSVRLSLPHGTSSTTTASQWRQSTRRMVYRRKTSPPQGNELKAPFSELVVTGRRQMAARADCDRTLARSHGDFDALLAGAEMGVLVDKTPETVAAV